MVEYNKNYVKNCITYGVLVSGTPYFLVGGESQQHSRTVLPDLL